MVRTLQALFMSTAVASLSACAHGGNTAQQESDNKAMRENVLTFMRDIKVHSPETTVHFAMCADEPTRSMKACGWNEDFSERSRVCFPFNEINSASVLRSAVHVLSNKANVSVDAQGCETGSSKLFVTTPR